MRKHWQRVSVGVAAAVALTAVGCNPVADDNRSAVSLAANWGTRSGFILDVVTSSGEPADDIATLQLESIVKNTSSTPSDYYTVDLLVYEVTYTRTDGANRPGIDVPFPFTEAMSGTVSPGSTTNAEIFLVTKEAKLESPLRDLWFGDNKRVFVTAQVVVYGRDRVGNSVQATTTTSIVFEDLPG